MFYNRILRVWVVDQVDYFLLSTLVGSILASCLKDYSSEKKAMERLKNSILKESKSLISPARPPLNSKQMRIKKDL